MPNSKIDSSRCPGSHPNNCRVLSVSEYTETALLPHDAQALEHENAQSDSIHDSLSTNPDIESDPTQLNTANSDMDDELAKLVDDLLRIPIDPLILEDNWESVTPCGESIEHGLLSSASRPDTVDEFVRNNVVKRPDSEGHLQIQEKSKASVEGSSSLSESACDPTSKFHEQEINHLELMDSVDPRQKHLDLRNNNSKENHFQRSLSNEKHGYVLPLDSDGDSKFEGKLIYSSSIGQNLFDGLLTKQGSQKRSSSGDNGETGENENENENDVSSIPCEGRLDIQDLNAAENYSDTAEANLILRFDKVLCSGSSATNPVTSSLEEASQLSSKISSLLKGDNNELDQMLKTGSGTEFSSEKLKDQLLQKHLKEKLCVWILQKVAEGGNGPSILDEYGQGVLHLAAALGYDWALEPTIVAGVSVDLRDVNGWTALHWAAFCGREHTVASLISLGAATRALTDPSPKYPSGRTPADLASVNGHKGIAESLAHCSLDAHISCINLDHQEDLAGPKAVQKISEICAAPLSLGNASDGQSQKDLSATSFRFLERGLEIPNVRRRRRPLGARVALFAVVAMVVIAQVAAGRSGDGCSGAGSSEAWCSEARFYEDRFSRAENLSDEEEKEKEDKGQDDEGQDDEGLEGEGPEKNDGPEKDDGLEKDGGLEKGKEEGKKRAPDSALESEKANKILKAYLAHMGLLTAYYNVQCMLTIQMLVLVFVEASENTRERKLPHIDVGFELSAIRV